LKLKSLSPSRGGEGGGGRGRRKGGGLTEEVVEVLGAVRASSEDVRRCV
jgi:hypothetical protein